MKKKVSKTRKLKKSPSLSKRGAKLTKSKPARRKIKKGRKKVSAGKHVIRGHSYRVLLFSALFLIMIVSAFFIARKIFSPAEAFNFEPIKNIPEIYTDNLEVIAGSDVLTIRPLEGKSVKVKKEGERYIYEKAYKNTDVIQDIYPYKIKEQLVFYGPGHPLVFKYKLGNLENFIVEKDSEGNINFYNKKRYREDNKSLSRVFTIPVPFIEDKVGKRSFSALNSFIEDDLFVVEIEEKWLKKAAYPVVLDPTIEINVLNVHSHPQQGEDWEVSFTTRGKADLRIIPADQATIDDDEFKGLFCDNEQRFPQILEGDVIYYPDWECNGIGKVVHYTKKVGDHVLRFEFAGLTAYAYNSIAIRSETSGVGDSDASGNYSITKPSDVQNGDYLVVVLAKDDDVAVTGDTGWTDADGGGAAAGNDVWMGIFYKKITDAGSEPSSYTFSGDAREEYSYWIASINGIDQSTPEDVTFSGTSTNLQDDLSPAAPSIQTNTDGAFIVAVVYTDQALNDSVLPGSPWTTETDDLGTSNGLNTTTRTLAAAGWTGDMEITNIASGQDSQVGQYAFKPEIANSNPVISSVEDGPEPVEVGRDISFYANWSDSDVEGVNLFVCTSSGGDDTGCPSSTYCSTAGYGTEDPMTCNYTTTSTGTKTYYAYVCDDQPSCSSEFSATFTVNPAVPMSQRFNGTLRFKFQGRIK